MIDQQDAGVLRDEILALMAVGVGDQIVKGPLHEECSVEQIHDGPRCADVVLDLVLHGDHILDPELYRAAVVAKAPLHGGRDHVEAEMLAETVGGDLPLPAFEISLDPPRGIFPEGPAGDTVFFQGQHPGFRDRQAAQHLLAASDIGRQKKILPFRKFFRLSGCELTVQRHGRDAQDTHQNCSELFSSHDSLLFDVQVDEIGYLAKFFYDEMRHVSTIIQRDLIVLLKRISNSLVFVYGWVIIELFLE